VSGAAFSQKRIMPLPSRIRVLQQCKLCSSIQISCFLSITLQAKTFEELRKLVALIDAGKIKLVLTEQIKDEFKRNRSAKIADAMKKLLEIRFTANFPAFAKEYAEYAELKTLLNKAGKKHAELVEKVTDDARDGNLKADALVANLRNAAIRDYRSATTARSPVR
jgi:hypothetical protein